jgi:hypothetical protein
MLSNMPRPLCPSGRAACIHRTVGWMDSIADMDAMLKRNIPLSLGSEPLFSGRSLVTILAGPCESYGKHHVRILVVCFFFFEFVVSNFVIRTARSCGL